MSDDSDDDLANFSPTESDHERWYDEHVLDFASEDHVHDFHASVYEIWIGLTSLQPHLVRSLTALKGVVSEHLRRHPGPGDGIISILLNGESSNKSVVMRPDDWSSLADLLNCTSRRHGISLLMDGELCQPSAIPSSFLLSLRQLSFELRILFLQGGPDQILSLLSQQNSEIHSVPVDPFSIGSLSFKSIQVPHISSFVNLGRSGPALATVWVSDAFKRENWESLDTLMALLESSPWLRWNNSSGGVPGEEWVGPYSPGDGLYRDELVKRIRALNLRNQSLRDSTRSAATTLLAAARPILLRPSSASRPQHAGPSSRTRSSVLAVAQSSGFPILSLPYEVLDTILSHLSSGCLSSKQHRLVINWVEDRSTLRLNKADSKTDFLRKSNCWRWESEFERVNLGHGYD